MPSIISASTTSGTALSLSSDTSGELQIRTGSTPTTALTITSGQNVGIGTTSPDRRLNVYGSSDSNALIEIGSSLTAAEAIIGVTSGSNTGFVGTLTNNDFTFRTNNTERMRIDSSGNVGIGTNSPSARLHVANAGVSAQATFVGTTLSPYITVVGNSGTTILGNESNGGWVGTTGSQAFVFKTSDTERMRIDASGRVTMPFQPAFFSTITGGSYSSGQTFGGSLVAGQPSARTANYNNGVFTAPVTGYYSFNFIAYDFNTTVAVYLVYKNGSAYIVGDNFQMISVSGAPMTSWSFTLYLAANDYIQMGLRSTSSTVNLYSGHSTWAGFFLG